MLQIIESIEKLIAKTITQIQFAIGEQKIDLIVTDNPSEDKRLLLREAMKNGAPL